MTDASGTVVWRAEHTPYGSIYTYRAGATLHQPLRLPGQTAQDGNDAYYNIFRWYRATWGRSTQPDPIGINGANNLFAYADANPITDRDPLGLVTVTDDITRYYYDQVDAWLQACANGAGECGSIGVKTTCTCAQTGNCWKASASVASTGEINLYTGDFQNLPRRPANPNIRNWEDALEHAYDFHVNPAVRAAVRVLSRTEAKKFNSESDCRTACTADRGRSAAAFLQTIRDTQAIEQRGWRR
jgi:RHS repeat-associated protein